MGHVKTNDIKHIRSITVTTAYHFHRSYDITIELVLLACN